MIGKRIKDMLGAVWAQVKRFGKWCKEHPFKAVSLALALYGGGDIVLTFSGCNVQKSRIIDSPGAISAPVSINGDNNNVSVAISTNTPNAKQLAKELAVELKKLEKIEQRTESDVVMQEVYGLFEVAQKSLKAVAEEKFERAVEFAYLGYGMATNALHQYEGGRFKARMSFVEDYCNVAFVVTQDALRRGDYNAVADVCHSVKWLVEGREIPYFAAMRRIAELRQSGGRQILFTDTELAELKKWDRERLGEMIGYLCNWGYLPFRRIDAQTGKLAYFSYYDFFGINPPTDPAMRGFFEFRTQAMSCTGKMIYSNEVSCQWIGFNSFQSFDVTDWRQEAEGVPAAERIQMPLKLTISNFVVNRNAKDPRFRFGMEMSTCANPAYSGPDKFVPGTSRIGIADQEMLAQYTGDEEERKRVPEPTTELLVVMGAAALALRRKGWKIEIARGD